ncbi:MAG: hypothetical protein RLW61_14210 [Gammaproteobacteria bacterium]
MARPFQPIDLSGQYPDEANAIEILTRTHPPAQPVAVYRTHDDEEPLQMSDGATTIIGRPVEQVLYAEPRDDCETCLIEVVAWYA